MSEFSGKVSSAHSKPLDDIVEDLESQLYDATRKADRRLEFMRYVEKHKKVCMFCYTRYHTDDCKWAKELRDAEKNT